MTISSLLADPLYTWTDASLDLVAAAVSGWLERFHDQSFSLTDAVSFELMRRERLKSAFAFDKHFHTAGFELLK
jgi:predicted nucleic acid-binding protein